MWGIQKNNKKNEIRKFFFSISIKIRFLEKLPLKLNKAKISFEERLILDTVFFEVNKNKRIFLKKDDYFSWTSF